MNKKPFTYLLLAAAVCVLVVGVVKAFGNKPDYTLIAAAFLLFGFYMQQRGTNRLREIMDEKAEQDKQKP